VHTTSLLAYLVVLICCHSHEIGLRENVGPERTVGEFEDIVGPDDVEAGLVLVHGVQDGLQTERASGEHRL